MPIDLTNPAALDAVIRYYPQLRTRDQHDPNELAKLNSIMAEFIRLRMELSIDTRRLEPIDDMIMLLKEAVSLTPETHPAYIDYIWELSSALVMHCTRSQPPSAEYLEDSIELSTLVVDRWPVGRPDRSRALFGLAMALTADINGNTLDWKRLSRAIDLEREALEQCPVGAIYHPHISAHYAGLLREVSNRDGSGADRRTSRSS
jgi:hypothetical protein